MPFSQHHWVSCEYHVAECGQDLLWLQFLRVEGSNKITVDALGLSSIAWAKGDMADSLEC